MQPLLWGPRPCIQQEMEWHYPILPSIYLNFSKPNDKQSLDIESTKSQLKVACLNDHEWDNFQAILSSNINHLRSSLQRQQDKKRCNAQANHKQYLYRRFYKITTKPSGDNTPNPPTHTVINLSDTALSDPQVKLLSRGLKFCPTPKDHNQLSLQQDIHVLAHFNRRLRLCEFFHIEPSTDDETPDDSPSGAPSHNCFKEKSVWVPPKNRDAALDNYINAVNSEVHRESPATCRCASNLSHAERDAIVKLWQATNLVIKWADKGSAVVVMNRDDYTAKALR